MVLARRAMHKLGRAQLARRLSTRASAILSSLDISTTEEISGVYDGQWRGSGDIYSSVCPTTGETLAYVKTATPQELDDALGRTREAYTIFRRESLLAALPPRVLDYDLHQMFQHHAEGRY